MTAPYPSTTRTLRTRFGGALALIPVVLSGYIHYLTTRGCFRADDFLNLYQINNYSLPQYLIIPNAGHLLVARNLVFYVSWLLFGTHAWPYLWSAFLTHLLNVWLLFLVIDLFTRSRSAAVFGAAVWGVCPLHTDAVGYYAVYGHVMVGTAILLVLLQAGRAAQAGTGPSTAMAAFWYALAIVAATCFGTGIAFAMVLPFVLAVLLPRWRKAWRVHVPLLSLLVVVPVLYVVLPWLYQMAFDQPLTVGPRFEMLLRAAPSAPIGFLRLLAFALFRLLLGPLPPASTFPAAYAVLAVLAVALGAVTWRAPAEVRRRIGACVLLALGCYGAVVMTRLFRIYDLPAQAMSADGRFHYAPLIPVTILLSFLWQWLGDRWPRASALLIGTWCVWVVMASVLRVPAPDRCVGSRRHLWKALVNIRGAISWTPAGETVVIPNRAFSTTAMPVVFPGWAGLFVIYYPDNVVDGKRVVFVERDPLVREWAQKGWRSRTLLVPPPEEPSTE